MKRETYDNGLFWPEPLPDGNKVIKTSMGMSILYSPFFFISHGIAKITGERANGYTWIYKAGLLLSAVVYLLIGLLFLRRILISYFTDQITTLTIITIVLGTNLLNYSTYVRVCRIRTICINKCIYMVHDSMVQISKNVQIDSFRLAWGFNHPG
ncbi:MAG: hypothetical protein IPF54_16285 [Draconibacterium sp.]|nr:hypothetical protein [Draconibacterium sp.]